MVLPTLRAADPRLGGGAHPRLPLPGRVEAGCDVRRPAGDLVAVSCAVSVTLTAAFGVQQGTHLAVVPAFTAGLLWAWLFPVTGR